MGIYFTKKMLLVLTPILLLHLFISSSYGTRIIAANKDRNPYELRESSYVLISTEDGTFSLVDMSSKKIVWRFQTNMPVYSSYKAPRYQYSQDEDRVPALDDDFYMDLDEEFRLYKCLMRNGKCINETFDASNFIKRLPYMMRDKTIFHAFSTYVFLLDWRTGKMVQMYSFDQEEYNKSFDESAYMVRVKRSDNKIECISDLSGDVLWSVLYSEMEAELMDGGDKNPSALPSNKDPEEVLDGDGSKFSYLILLILGILFVCWLFKLMKERYASNKRKAKKKAKKNAKEKAKTID